MNFELFFLFFFYQLLNIIWDHAMNSTASGVVTLFVLLSPPWPTVGYLAALVTLSYWNSILCLSSSELQADNCQYPSRVGLLYGAACLRNFLLLGILETRQNTGGMYWGCLWNYRSSNQSHKFNFYWSFRECMQNIYIFFFSWKTLFVWQLHHIFAIWGFVGAKYIWLSIVIKISLYEMHSVVNSSVTCHIFVY